MTTQEQSIRNIFGALKGRRSTAPGPSALESFAGASPAGVERWNPVIERDMNHTGTGNPGPSALESFKWIEPARLTQWNQQVEEELKRTSAASSGPSGM